MPLIKRRPKETLKPFTVRLPESLAKRLEDYADYTNVPVTEIVAAALTYTIDSDKEFFESRAPETHQRRTADNTDAAAPHPPEAAVPAHRKSTATA